MKFVLPVENFGDNSNKIPAGLMPSEDLLEKYYLHVEKDYKGGYFPLGSNTIWHGGIHIHAPQGEKIHCMADGVIVAARLGDDAVAIKHYGSNNFIIVKHTLKSTVYYSLYQHLNCESLESSNPVLRDFLWLCDNGEKDIELCEKLKKGEVCKIDRAVKAGDVIWTVGVYGSKTVIKNYRAPMFHWGVFSQEILPGNWTTREDHDDNINCDNSYIAAILGNVIDKNKDGNWSEDEITEFYKNNPRASTFRDYACFFLNENAVNWDIVCKTIESKLHKKASPEAIKPYNFWDEAKTAGVILPSSKKVWHYNPVYLIEQYFLREKELKEWAIKQWFVQIGGLDQVGRLGGPLKNTFGQWSNENWQAIGKTSDTLSAAEARWQDLMDCIKIEEVNSKNATSVAIAVNILDPEKFNFIILREAVILLEKYKYMRVFFPHIDAGHPLYDKQFRKSFQYLIYHAGHEPENIYPLILSGMVYSCRCEAYKSLRKSLETSELSLLINELKSKIKGLLKEEVVKIVLDKEDKIRTWLCNETNIELFTGFLETCNFLTWPAWDEHRGNVSRYLVLNEYYKKVFR
jgi:hypothetical protein